MEVRVRKIEGIRGSVTAPPSKSYTHRSFIIASLAEGTSKIKNCLRAGDTLATLKACRAFGVKIEENEEITIQGSGGKLKTPESAIDCENSGTTIRLIAGIAALDGEVTLTGDASIQRRPMQPLLDALGQLGVESCSTNGTPPLVIKGGNFEGGEARIRGDISSQFISSLLIAAPYAKNDVRITITTQMKSKPYVDLTLDMMEKFGVKVENKSYKEFLIKAGQKYRGREYEVEGDYSSASYFLALAAMTHSEITVKNLFRDSKQGDRQLLRILKKMGAEVTEKNREVAVKGGELKGINVDLGNAPDLLPTVAALACKAKGKTVIKNVAHARLKESDRIAACSTELSKFGVSIEEKKDGLVVHGTGRLTGAKVNSVDKLGRADHRMAMALTIAGLAAEGETTIENAECVQISYPEFFDVLKSLGVTAVYSA